MNAFPDDFAYVIDAEPLRAAGLDTNQISNGWSVQSEDGKEYLVKMFNLK